MCSQAEVRRENAVLIWQLGMLVRTDPFQPIFNDVNGNLELQSHRSDVRPVLLVHLLAQKRERFAGNFRLPVGRAHLLFARISLSLGMPRVIYVNGGEHHDQQYVGDGRVRHHLVDAESKYLL